MPQDAHQFGKYRLLRRIASGGMGEVHLAKLVGPSGFEKLVVIKRLLAERQGEQKFVDMFFSEARLAAQLGHSNIAQIYEVGTIDDVPYIAMEYVHGKSLRKVIDAAATRRTTASHDAIPVALVVQAIVQLCQGLNFAHEARHLSGTPLGLIHRDINPHNVLISYQGEVKIIDFGIAKSELTWEKTQVGTIKGTVVYMSPEQSLGHKLDRRSDLFSVGIVLYEALSNHNPFHKGTLGASLEAIRQAQPPAISSFRPELVPFVPLFARALARAPESRFADCAALSDALKALLDSGMLPKSPLNLAEFMAELFAQEMAEEERALERTDAAIVEGLVAPGRGHHATRVVPRAKAPAARPAPRQVLDDAAVEAGQGTVVTPNPVAATPDDEAYPTRIEAAPPPRRPRTAVRSLEPEAAEATEATRTAAARDGAATGDGGAAHGDAAERTQLARPGQGSGLSPSGNPPAAAAEPTVAARAGQRQSPPAEASQASRSDAGAAAAPPRGQTGASATASPIAPPPASATPGPTAATGSAATARAAAAGPAQRAWAALTARFPALQRGWAPRAPTNAAAAAGSAAPPAHLAGFASGLAGLRTPLLGVGGLAVGACLLGWLVAGGPASRPLSRVTPEASADAPGARDGAETAAAAPAGAALQPADADPLAAAPADRLDDAPDVDALRPTQAAAATGGARAGRGAAGRRGGGRRASAAAAPPTLAVSAEPSLSVRHNAHNEGKSFAIHGGGGNIEFGGNPASDAFLIRVRYLVEGGDITYTLDASPWATVYGAGGIELGRTPLTWNHASPTSTFEFRNPRVRGSQTITLRLGNL